MFKYFLSNKVLYSLLCLMIFITFIVSGSAYSAEPEYIMLKVNSNDSVAVNLRKYGVNGALLYSKYGYNSDKLVDLYRNIGIFFIRFPGGTIGNYYNWKSENFSCHIKPDKKSKSRIDGMNKALTNNNKSYNVHQFIGFVNKTGSDFTYVLNTMCTSMPENIELLKFLKKQNVDLNYIELANEVYSPAYAWAYKTPEDYIKNSNEYFSEIKRYYPNAKVGMVVSPISFVGKNKPRPGGQPNKSWPERLRGMDSSVGSTPESDALIIHLYGYPYGHRYSFFDPEDSLGIYQKVIQQFNSNFNASIEYLEHLGKDKSIWITEWGVTVAIKKRSKAFKKYKKSALQGLFVASAFIPISLKKSIKIANYHILSDLWNNTKSGPVISQVGEVFKLYIDAAKKTKLVYKVSAVGKNIKGDSGLKKIKSILFSSDLDGYIFLINEGGKSYVVNDIDLQGLKLKYDSYSIEQFVVENEVFNISNITSRSSKSINIKPYSVTRIKLFNRN